jgi:hypothetical protein
VGDREILATVWHLQFVTARSSNMAKRAGLIVGGVLATALIGANAHGDTNKQDQKFCDALAKFHADFAALESIGPTSTLAELRATSDKVGDDADNVEKAASKIKSPTAKQFTESAKQLRREIRAMPESTTIEQAKSRIRDDVQNVKQAGHKLAMESGCPETDTQMKPGAKPSPE